MKFKFVNKAVILLFEFSGLIIICAVIISVVNMNNQYFPSITGNGMPGLRRVDIG